MRYLAGVLGHPIAHSLSPRLHLAAYEACGLPDRGYLAFDVVEEDLAAFLAAREATAAATDDDGEWVGVSMTMPLKQRALELLGPGGAADRVALATGAANTMVFTAEGRRAYNTDVAGVRGALAQAGADRAETPAVLGGGATAASAVAALIGLGAAEVTVYVRDASRAGLVRETADALGGALRIAPLAGFSPFDGGRGHDVVVSTLPAGAADGLAVLRGDPSAAGRAGLAGRTLLDVVYAPWPTPLSRWWADGHGTVADGLWMLVHQAADQFGLFAAEAAARAGRPLSAGGAAALRQTALTAMHGVAAAIGR